MIPLVSVIIPVFNVEKYLPKCLDSVLNQTYKKTEIIIVDDGSTDNSLQVCMDYKLRYPEIVIIHQDNKGLSAARNEGISRANGDYFMFVDSDDFVSNEFVELMVYAIEKTGTEIATTRKYVSFYESNESSVVFDQSEDIEKFITTYNHEDFIKLMMLEKICTGAQFKIYNRKIFEDYKFPQGYFEDLAVLYKIFWRQDTISVIDMKLYAYRKRNDGIIRNNNIGKKQIILDITNEMMGYYENAPYDVLKAVKARAFMAVFSVFLQVPWEEQEVIRIMWERILKYRDLHFIFMNNKKLFLETILSYMGRRKGHVIGTALRKMIG
ncbi:glycosyltransferase family 2 protein [Butyrivibrio sp. NC2002]|uniref:glycosyltransferase family 2 protein n=1 Tax=Butyrivibrio sp. NC2002 TaxID=1410610 RepID=UPI00068A3ED8|nr:glycosyltransferase family 2 protein [Butyrivibrio sp. NC2002]